MIKKRIAAIAMGAALATSAIIAPQASADARHYCKPGYERVQGKCTKVDNHKKHWDGRKGQGNHKDRWDGNKKQHHDKGHDNYKHHRGSSLSSW